MIQDCPTAATPWLGLLALVSILVAACAPTVVQQATQSFRLSRTAKVPLSTGYSTTLRENSRWELVGTIRKGTFTEPGTRL